MDNLFPRNEAMWDRAMRVVLGLFVISLVFWGPKSLWGLLGIVPVLTGLMGSCPLYTLLGIGTCAVPEKKA